jgi:hypothetical protein
MKDLLRDTAAGNFIRYVTRYKLLHYPEEVLNFELPQSMADDKHANSRVLATNSTVKQYGEVRGRNESEVTTAGNSIANGETLERSDHDSVLQQIATQVIRPVPIHGEIILVDWYSKGEVQG